jgi:hypothetical protein
LQELCPINIKNGQPLAKTSGEPKILIKTQSLTVRYETVTGSSPNFALSNHANFKQSQSKVTAL